LISLSATRRSGFYVNGTRIFSRAPPAVLARASRFHNKVQRDAGRAIERLLAGARPLATY